MRILITAGPTREPIDAVRYISNRSSGRMGSALASAAAAAGHQVTLLLGPVQDAAVLLDELAPQVQVMRFETCKDLENLLHKHFGEHDMLIMAAAVADYRPKRTEQGKLKRREGGEMTLNLQPTPDLVAETARRKRADQRVVAFALEPQENLHASALEKLKRKAVDAIVGNPLSAMDSDQSSAVLLRADGRRQDAGPMDKPQLAQWLITELTA